MGSVFIHQPHMSPEILVAVFPFDRFARLPLFFGDLFQMAVPGLVEAMIGEKDCFDDSAMLPDRDHRQILDIEVHCYRHQVRITLALHDSLGLNRLGLREVNGHACFCEHQFGREGLPVGFGAPLLKIAAVTSGIVDPLPVAPCVDAQAHTARSQIDTLQGKRAGALVEGRMIARGGHPWLALLLPRCPAWVAVAVR